MSGIFGSYCQCIFNLTRNLSNHFPEWLVHFLFLPAVYESFSCSESLSALDIVSIYTYFSSFNHANRYVVVSHNGA